MSFVPVNIRPHLVLFFFKDSLGKEYFYKNTRVKAVSFSSTTSPIGRIIRLLMIKADRPVQISQFNLNLSISDTPDRKYKGTFYKQENGRNSFLMLPKEANEDINDLLESMFRISFVSYINGCVENNDKSVIVYAINNFIDKYNLLEFGFNTESLRRLYYREKNHGKILSRLETKQKN